MQGEFERPQERAGIKVGFSTAYNSVLKEIPESKMHILYSISGER